MVLAALSFAAGDARSDTPAPAGGDAAPAEAAPDPATPPVIPPPKDPALIPTTPDVAPPGHPTHFEPWYRGPNANRRFFNIGLTLAFEVASFVPQRVATPTSCRWCSSNSLDTKVRNSLVWKDAKRADLFSTITTYYVSPVAGAVLLYFSDKDESWRRLIDDTLPVAESIAVTNFITNVVKVSVARQRPYAHFSTTPTEPSSEDNLSFLSGHSSFGFALTTGAAYICHIRHYKTEPYVWAAGITLSLSTEYFRIAADKHYLTDVLAGGFLGIGAGLTIPRLMRRNLIIVPAPETRGVNVVGMF